MLPRRRTTAGHQCNKAEIWLIILGIRGSILLGNTNESSTVTVLMAQRRHGHEHRHKDGIQYRIQMVGIQTVQILQVAQDTDGRYTEDTMVVTYKALDGMLGVLKGDLSVV